MEHSGDFIIIVEYYWQSFNEIIPIANITLTGTNNNTGVEQNNFATFFGAGRSR
jgi:hypothetical protein